MGKARKAEDSSGDGDSIKGTSELSPSKQGEEYSAPLNGGKKGKYRKEKPWDTDDIDHWKIEKFLPVGLL